MLGSQTFSHFTSHKARQRSMRIFQCHATKVIYPLDLNKGRKLPVGLPVCDPPGRRLSLENMLRRSRLCTMRRPMVNLFGRRAGRQNPEQYHLNELEIALNAGRAEHVMPPIPPAPARVLDIGCGAGQTLIAGCADRISFGMDIDETALKLGTKLTQQVRFAQGFAEALPFKNDVFDLVIARVSLPYTILPESLPEIRRVLKPGGVLWSVLHPFRLTWAQVRRGGYKRKLLFVYILANSLLFHGVQKQFVFAGRCESFQTRRGIRKALENCGLDEVQIELNGQQFLVTARKA